MSIRCEFLDLRKRRSCEEVFVRKVVAVELVSVDGVMESPERWAFTYSNDEMEETNAAGMAASDARSWSRGKRFESARRLSPSGLDKRKTRDKGQL